MEDQDNPTEAGCMIAIIMTPVSIVLRSWCLVKLWAWYVAPIFAIDEITMVYAFGLSTTLALLHPTQGPKPKSTGFAGVIEASILSILLPLACLFYGFIGTLWL